MGIHRQRLRASNAQRFFNARVKTGLQKWAVKKYGREIPVASISPSTIKDIKTLSIPVPPILEEALGYRGNLRFVEFGYSPKTRRFGYCDGGDHIPTDHHLWIRFLRHPLIGRHLPKSRYPTLYGVFPRNYQRAIEEFFADGSQGRFPTPHRLLLDRKDRRVYLCRIEHTLLFFALKEPENEDRRRIFLDGFLMSAGCEDYKLPPPKKLAAELLAWLDRHLKLASI